MMIVGQGIGYLAFAHDDEGGAIGKAPSLIGKIAVHFHGIHNERSVRWNDHYIFGCVEILACLDGLVTRVRTESGHKIQELRENKIGGDDRAFLRIRPRPFPCYRMKGIIW